MGLFDRVSKVVNDATDKITKKYQKEGLDGILNATAEKLTQAANTIINTTQAVANEIADSVSKNMKDNEVKQSNKIEKYKDLFLNQGQIAELNCMPMDLVLKHLNAENNIDGDKNKYKLGNIVILLKDQHWLNVNEQNSMKMFFPGTIPLVEYILKAQNNIVYTKEPEVLNNIYNGAMEILSKISETKEYKSDLSVWIKEATKKNKIEEKTPEVKPKVVKKVVKPVEEKVVQSEKTPEVKPKAVKKVVKPVEEKIIQPEKAPEVKPKAVKKVVKPIEEKIVQPEKAPEVKPKAVKKVVKPIEEKVIQPEKPPEVKPKSVKKVVKPVEEKRKLKP